MKNLVSVLLTFELIFSPHSAVAASSHQPASTPGPTSTQTVDTNEDPKRIVESDTIITPSGDVITHEREIIVAESVQEKSSATKWFIHAIKSAPKNIKRMVFGISTPTQTEIVDANAIHDALPEDTPKALITMDKSVFTRLKETAQTYMQKAKDTLATFSLNNPYASKMIFVAQRGIINGTFASYTYNYFVLDGSIPTWLAWTTGLTLGTMSASINYFSEYYSKWLNNPMGERSFNILKKIYPNLTESDAKEIKGIAKWSGLEVFFIAIPILILKYLPQALGLGDGYDLSDTFLGLIAANTVSYFGAIWSQYFWDKGITRALVENFKRDTNEKMRAWHIFRTNFLLAFISITQVPIVALSQGDYKIASWTALGLLGALGLKYHLSVIRDANEFAKKHTQQEKCLSALQKKPAA